MSTQSFIPTAVIAATGAGLSWLLWRTRNTAKHETCVSAPGKVLITGGYLVLDPKYSGLVLGTSSRFYTAISSTSEPSAHEEQTKINISLHSPQFHYETRYTFICDAQTGISKLLLPDDSNYKRNPYIEYTLLYSLTVSVLSSPRGKHTDMKIRLVADNDFYSQRENLKNLSLPVSLESLQKLKKFYVPKNKNDIHKTGLGSSAAMVTSLTAAVLQHFNVVKIPYEDEAVELDHLDDPYKEIIHRTAQFCHCLAQGKIGSGFDVASATFGSQKYTRFDPSILESLLQYGITKMEQKQGEHVYALACEQTHIQELLDTLELEKLSTSGTSIWDTKHETFQLPPLFHLFVADVDQGSNTPNMVRSVLQWRKENPQLALEMWTEIDTLNTKVENAFNELTSMSHRDPKGYKETLTTLGQVKFSEWNSASVARGQVRNYMIEIRTMFVQIRQLLKKMGQLAFNEPIEPDQQTNLLDATMNVPGCLIAGVPGAGGFDAIFSILFGEEQEVKTRVASLWTNYTDASVCPLVLNESLSKGVVQSREKAVWG